MMKASKDERSSKASGDIHMVYSSRTGKKDAEREMYAVGWKQVERRRRIKVQYMGFPCINSPPQWWPYGTGSRSGGHE